MELEHPAVRILWSGGLAPSGARLESRGLPGKNFRPVDNVNTISASGRSCGYCAAADWRLSRTASF